MKPPQRCIYLCEGDSDTNSRHTRRVVHSIPAARLAPKWFFLPILISLSYIPPLPTCVSLTKGAHEITPGRGWGKGAGMRRSPVRYPNLSRRKDGGSRILSTKQSAAIQTLVIQNSLTPSLFLFPLRARWRCRHGLVDFGRFLPFCLDQPPAQACGNMVMEVPLHVPGVVVNILVMGN